VFVALTTLTGYLFGNGSSIS